MYQYVSICINMYQYVSICINMYQYVSICINMYQYVSIWYIYIYLNRPVTFLHAKLNIDTSTPGCDSGVMALTWGSSEELWSVAGEIPSCLSCTNTMYIISVGKYHVYQVFLTIYIYIYVCMWFLLLLLYDVIWLLLCMSMFSTIHAVLVLLLLLWLFIITVEPKI